MATGLDRGVVLLGLFHTGEWSLLALGQSPSLAIEGAEVLAMFGWGMPAVLLFAATTMFLESIGRPLPGMVFMLVSNVLNVALNWLFIYGHLGAPEMGAEGAALATTIARWAGTAGLFGWVYATLGASRLGARPGRLALGRNRRRRAHRPGGGFSPSAFRSDWPTASKQARSRRSRSSPAGSAASRLPPTASCSISSPCPSCRPSAFPPLPTFGWARRTGGAIGEGAREAAWAAFRIILVLQLAIGLGYALFAGFLAGLYTGEAAVLAIAIPAVRVAGLALLPDALQVVLVGCLRGLPTSGRPPAS